MLKESFCVSDNKVSISSQWLGKLSLYESVAKTKLAQICISLLPKVFKPQTVRSRNYKHLDIFKVPAFLISSQSSSFLWVIFHSFLPDQRLKVQHTALCKYIFFSVTICISMCKASKANWWGIHNICERWTGGHCFTKLVLCEWWAEHRRQNLHSYM